MASLPPLMPIADRAGRERPPNNSSPSSPSRSRSSSPFFRVLVPKDGVGGVGTPPRIGRNAAVNTKGRIGAGWTPPRITPPRIRRNAGTLGMCSDCDRNNDPAAIIDKNSLSVESYAVYHDEIVTSLIDEALRKGDESNVTDGQQAVETNTESRSPCKTKRNTSKQLGIGSPGIPKLLKRARSDLPGEMEDKNNLLTLNTSSRRRSLTMNSKMKSNDPSYFFHQDCILKKEMGSDTQKSKLGFGLTKAKTKYCIGAPYATGREETLLKLQQKLSMLGDIESGKYGMAAEMLRSDAVAFAIEADSDCSSNIKKACLTKVETRSILTLRMGFVSMSYGILLQWDCRAGLVELIVLRKMCRDDFLKGKGNIDESNLKSVSQRNPSLPRMPILPPKPALIPAPLADVSPTEVSLDSTSPPDFHRNGCGRRALPKLSLTNPLAGIPRFLGGATSSELQYFLSVSVLRVTGLFAECNSCRKNTSVGRTVHGAPLRKHRTVRPFIRFSLGRHEHCTRVTIINSGNAKWSQRHQNSCLLPCPPEEFSWFAGREDLVVEVLNDWENPGSSGKVGTSGKPILAAVKVPLSFVNIENEDDISTEGGKWKQHTGKDGASFTNITIPLRMNCCTNAPLGSISLKITMKAPSHGGGVNTSSNPPAPSKPNIQVVNESIELGLLTRYMGSWSLGGGARETRDAPQTNLRKIRKRLRWSKRFDLETKRWTNLSPNPSMQNEESRQGEGTFGWFTFLNNK
jgi:hypothetical protein